MSESHIRIDRRAGRITLNRPQALNALTYDMIRAIESALDDWRDDPAVGLIVIDAAGDKAFCAGGDIADLYRTGKAGDYAFGRQFWRDEYRLNAKLATCPKPIVSFLQGFTMGGGVGVGCHARHRIVGDTSQIAMPECGIGLVPDVGGSLLLARAPGRLGEYFGLTGARMGPGDAIHMGFADHYLPESGWAPLIGELESTGSTAPIDAAAQPAPPAKIPVHRGDIDAIFARDTLAGIAGALAAAPGDFAARTLQAIQRNSPLSMACALSLIARVRARPTIHHALGQEYRFTARAMEHGDFLEGIRAAIIDKDRAPRWPHSLDSVPPDAIEAMLAPLGEHDLTWETET
ncbi:MAG: enoyl-CoA hydratase/isomerase family protein [Rhodobacter sp.]|nr:enoyl-CoA hydratase/isomerase family protein [Rhodobacter sp.]